jgi:glucose uptake protein GlcU
LRMLSVWGFLASLVALGTFYLASVGVPFALGAIGCTLGLVAFSKNRKDRHGLVATILGAVSLVLAVVFLSLG